MKEAYPDGFEDSLISFQTPKGELAVGIRLETEEADYMIRMPSNAIPEMEEDDDSDSDSSDDKDFVNLDSLQIAEDGSSDEE